MADPLTGEWLLSASVVTTARERVVGELHDRMPVILAPDAWRIWLDPEVRDEDLLQSLLEPAPDDLLRLDAANPLVNNANNEGPGLLVAPPATEVEEPALTLNLQ